MGYVGEMAALVDRPGGGPPALVESTLPLRAAPRGGVAEPIDLTLEREGEGYVPRRVPVGVRFPSRLGDGISLAGAGVRVTPAGGGDGEATSADGRLWWPNVATDTDFSVVPRFDGFETAHVLRSPESPQELRLGLDLPAGATLRRSNDRFPGWVGAAGTSSPAGAVEVVRGGEVLARVSPPLAFDAQRQPVPVRMEVEGSGVVLRVAHRDRDVAYPLLVDPIVEDQQFWNGRCSWDPWNPNCQAPPKDQNGWSFDSYSASGLIQTTGADIGWGPGRYIWSEWDNWYDHGDYGNWRFQAPGNSRITSAHFNFLRSQVSEAGACTVVGMLSTAAWVWERQWVSCTDVWDQQIVFDHPGSPHNQAIFQHWMQGRDWRGAWGGSYMGGALVVLEDDYDPFLYRAVEHRNRPPGWTARATPQADVFVQDDGLGARTVSVLYPGRSGGTVERKPTFPNGRDYYCEGGRNDRCPAQLGWGVAYNTDDMPEGINEVRARGYDVVGRMAASAPWQLKVDRTAPSLALSGSLKAAENTQLAPGTYELRADATDGDPSGSAAARRSGVRSVEILLDGEPVESGTQECPGDSCPLSRSFAFDTRQHPGGQHRVEVRSTDQLGQQSSQSLTCI